LFYQDALMGLFDRHVNSEFPAFYRGAAHTLAQKAQGSKYAYAFTALSKLCEVLALKCGLGARLKTAYCAGDREALRQIAQSEIPEILRRTDIFYAAFREQWMAEKKASGFDVQDIRIGALKARLSAASVRILEYLEGKTASIEELEEERLFFDGRPEAGENLNFSCNLWSRMVTPNVIG
jgi:hypothetical protein